MKATAFRISTRTGHWQILTGWYSRHEIIYADSLVNRENNAWLLGEKKQYKKVTTENLKCLSGLSLCCFLRDGLIFLLVSSRTSHLDHLTKCVHWFSFLWSVYGPPYGRPWRSAMGWLTQWGTVEVKRLIELRTLQRTWIGLGILRGWTAPG